MNTTKIFERVPSSFPYFLIMYNTKKCFEYRFTEPVLDKNWLEMKHVDSCGCVVCSGNRAIEDQPHLFSRYSALFSSKLFYILGKDLTDYEIAKLIYDDCSTI